MAFVIDGSEWSLDRFESTANFFCAIEQVIERAYIAEDRRETVWIGDDFQTRSMDGELDLWSVVSQLGASGELRQELASWLSRAPCYLDTEWPEGIEGGLWVEVGGGPAEENSDIAWIHHCNRIGRPVACLSLSRSGCFETTSHLGTVSTWWVQSEADHVGFWRSQIADGDGERLIQQLAPHAFPDICFTPNVWRGIRGFAGGYASASEKLRKCLSVLNDFGSWIFTTPPPALRPEDNVAATAGSATRDIIQRRFTGYGLTVAPEANEVGLKARYRAPREVVLGSRTLYCEWHEKLEPHQNRVYFHGPVPESDGKIVIGIFSHHLPLPGD